MKKTDLNLICLLLVAFLLNGCAVLQPIFCPIWTLNDDVKANPRPECSEWLRQKEIAAKQSAINLVKEQAPAIKKSLEDCVLAKRSTVYKEFQSKYFERAIKAGKIDELAPCADTSYTSNLWKELIDPKDIQQIILSEATNRCFLEVSFPDPQITQLLFYAEIIELLPGYLSDSLSYREHSTCPWGQVCQPQHPTSIWNFASISDRGNCLDKVSARCLDGRVGIPLACINKCLRKIKRELASNCYEVGEHERIMGAHVGAYDLCVNLPMIMASDACRNECKKEAETSEDRDYCRREASSLLNIE
jgi:hypothetical protein